MKSEIQLGKTIFQDATNDESLKVVSGRTLYPDVLLFADKISGVVFNGWELKFPETPVDDKEMLENALEKAQALKADSFVTWNGAEAIIWGIAKGDYTLQGLVRLKEYPKEPGIQKREDLAIKTNYAKYEYKLQSRLKDILADLALLFQRDEIAPAINISSELIDSIGDTAEAVIPQIEHEIILLKGSSLKFRNEFRDWKLLESSTLNLLKKMGNPTAESVLARFVFYKFVGKIIFYLTLQNNLSGKLPELILSSANDVAGQLKLYFDKARQIDYQAVFETDFADAVSFNSIVDAYLTKLIKSVTQFDFKLLPNEVVGNILENLVPLNERKQFGQYFSPEILAYLVAFPVIETRYTTAIDPTSGTGTFLTAFYNILKFHGQKNHSKLLDQVWGNDISHFPAILSVINLYKQNIDSAESGNYPRIVRSDFFSITPGDTRKFPDNRTGELSSIELPLFDAVASNFPFVQQEDAVKTELPMHFAALFGTTQAAFLKGRKFYINQKADYYTYCFYQSLQFLKPQGQLAAVTSNAWLGKDYGLQLKEFLLDNFRVRYVVKSEAEHWFQNAQVSTVFVVVQRGGTGAPPARFVTMRQPLAAFGGATAADTVQRVADFYDGVDTCEQPANADWVADADYPTAYEHRAGHTRVSLVPAAQLRAMLTTRENWESCFLAADLLAEFAGKLVYPAGTVFQNGRGTRTGANGLFVLTAAEARQADIESRFLQPILKSSRELTQLHHRATPATYLFVCREDEPTLRRDYPGAYAWVKRWEKAVNENEVPLPQVLGANSPHWYTLKAEAPARIFTSINPNKRLFFSYTDAPMQTDQRLVAIRPIVPADTALVTALLNSVLTLLIVEVNGTARNLGALDLNADFFKTTIQLLNPALLNPRQRQAILDAFRPLSQRPVEDYNTEFNRPDRRHFDQAVFTAFGLPTSRLPRLYRQLTTLIGNRVTRKDK